MYDRDQTTMHRRTLLFSTAGAISAATLGKAKLDFPIPDACSRQSWQTTYTETLAGSTNRNLLGIPRSSRFVREGIHPFSPERTLVLSNRQYKGNDRFNTLVSQVTNELDRNNAPDFEEAVYLVVYAATGMSRKYDGSEQSKVWSLRLASWLFEFYRSIVRDRLWICPMPCQAFAETARTMNAVVDWWLILIPSGMNVSSFDGTRVHVMIIPVFSQVGVPRLPGEFWQIMATVVGLRFSTTGESSSIDSTWLKVSQMNHKSACLFLNERVIGNLRQIA